MIAGGNATVYVSNMDAAVGFYGQALGLKVTNRFADRWATIGAGPSYWTTDRVNAGLVLGLHPAVDGRPAPGTPGGVSFGLETYMPLETVTAKLAPLGVKFIGDIIRFDAGNVIMMEDVDGNPTYIHEFPPEMIEADGVDAPGDAATALIKGPPGTLVTLTISSDGKRRIVKVRRARIEVPVVASTVESVKGVKYGMTVSRHSPAERTVSCAKR